MSNEMCKKSNKSYFPFQGKEAPASRILSSPHLSGHMRLVVPLSRQILSLLAGTARTFLVLLVGQNRGAICLVSRTPYFVLRCY